MMRRRKSLLVRADASTQIGAGHVMRCLALGKAWQGAGGDVTFASAEIMPAVKRRLQQETINVVAIEGESGSELDGQHTGDLAKGLHAEWVVVDGYCFGPTYYRQLRQREVHSVAIDDDGRFEEYTSDVVLNQNASATETIYRNRQPYTKLLLGSSFVLLRPEFTSVTCKRDTPQVARNLLVTMGGSDPENVTLKVLRALNDSWADDVNVKIVLGSGYRHTDELRALVSTSKLSVSVEENPPDMVPLMAWADMAISAAGGTCWELAYMGVPSILTAISPDQVCIARAAMDRGAAYSLGWHADISGAHLAESVRMLGEDHERRRAMSRAGQKLVDGVGPKRVVEFLRSAA